MSADPAYVDVPTGQLISKDYARARRERDIDLNKAKDYGPGAFAGFTPRPPGRGGLDTNDQPLQSAAVLTSSGASVTADKIDYPPGDIVVITGTGWQPGEPVSLVIHEEPTTYGEVVLSAAVAEIPITMARASRGAREMNEFRRT